MRIARSRAYGTMAQIVRQRASPYTLTRPQQTSSGRFGESSETTTTISGVEMWLYNPNEINVDTEYGDRLGGDIQGFAQPSADVAVHDRVSHGGDTYEVEQIMHLPDNDRQVLKQFSLQKQTNDGGS